MHFSIWVCTVLWRKGPFAPVKHTDPWIWFCYFPILRSHFVIWHMHTYAKFAHACAQNVHIQFTRENDCDQKTQVILPEIMFFDLVTLTVELGLDIIKVHPETKICIRTTNGSVRRVLNYRYTHTHWTDSITSTADEGGNNHGMNRNYPWGCLHTYAPPCKWYHNFYWKDIHQTGIFYVQPLLDILSHSPMCYVWHVCILLHVYHDVMLS